MIQSKQVGGPASRSILNYRLTCGFCASVFRPYVSKEDNGAVVNGHLPMNIGEMVVGITGGMRLRIPFTEKCAGFDSPAVFCW
jgi:hypothetical protein